MERIEVATRKSLKDAIDNKYKVIVIVGDLADEVLKELNDKKKEKISKLSDLSIILGWFLWPLLIAGVAGKIISKDDFKKYNASIENDTIVLTRKKWIKDESNLKKLFKMIKVLNGFFLYKERYNVDDENVTNNNFGIGADTRRNVRGKGYKQYIKKIWNCRRTDKKVFLVIQ